MLEPFFSTKLEGRGLGLAAVAGIIRGHHGALEVHSEIGGGSTFRVLLPAAEGVPARDTLSGIELSDVSERLSGTILVVDDEDRVREVLSDMLETLGLDVVTAYDGAVAIEIFRESPGSFRAVILDLAMPTMGGAKTMRALRTIRPDVPVIICTGYGDRNLEGTDASAFLQKPFKLATLVKTLEEALGAA